MNAFPLVPERASSLAGEVDAVFLFILGVTGFFAVAIWIALLWFAVRYRRRSAADRPGAIEGSLALELTWTLVPLGLMAVMFVWGARVYFHMNRPPDDAMTVTVVGKHARKLDLLARLGNGQGALELDAEGERIGAVAPSGTVDFTDPLSGQAVTGTTTYATFNDGGGNPTLQATFKFTPNVNVSVNSSYKGDSNYPAAQTFGTASVVVNGSDYNLSTSAPSLTVTRGAQGTIQIAVQGQSNYNATLNFAASMCSGLPAESSCAFSPLSVAGPGATTLTISTTAPHTVALNSNNGPIFWMAMSGLLSCVVLLGVPRSRKRIGRRRRRRPSRRPRRRACRTRSSPANRRKQAL